MQHVTFDPTIIIINHGLKILDLNSINIAVYLISLDIMQCYQYTAYSLNISHLLVVLVVLVDLMLCHLLILYLLVVLVVLFDLCVMFKSLIFKLMLTIRNQQNKMFHQVRTLH